MSASARSSPPQGRAPGVSLQLLEVRAFWEHYASIALRPFWPAAPLGDGHPILVLPGLVAGDASTLVLRRFLRSRGFSPRGWGQGVNLRAARGCTATSARYPPGALRTARACGQHCRLEPRRPLCPRIGQTLAGHGAPCHNIRLAVHRTPARDERLAFVRVRKRPSNRFCMTFTGCCGLRRQCRRHRSGAAPMVSSLGSAASKRGANLRKTSWSTQATLALALIQPPSTRSLIGWLNPRASGGPSTAETGVNLSIATLESSSRHARAGSPPPRSAAEAHQTMNSYRFQHAFGHAVARLGRQGIAPVLTNSPLATSSCRPFRPKSEEDRR